jgi:hypothetical protein
MISTATNTLRALGSVALLADPFNSYPQPVPGMDKFQTIIGWSAWIAAGLCLIGLIVTGATLAVSYHRGTNEHVGRLAGVAAGCLIVGGASTVVGALV